MLRITSGRMMQRYSVIVARLLSIYVRDGKEGSGEEGAEDEQNAKRCRPSTSAVWLDFEKLFKTVNDKKVWYAAN
jgi:hypothetical protein